MIGAATARPSPGRFRVTVADLQRHRQSFDAQAALTCGFPPSAARLLSYSESLGYGSVCPCHALCAVPHPETYEEPGSEVTLPAESQGYLGTGIWWKTRFLAGIGKEMITRSPRLITVCTFAARLQSTTKQSGEWLLTFDNGDVISSRLVISADGAKSQVRNAGWYQPCGWQYRQSCMLITVDTGREQRDIRRQQFSRPARVRFCRCLILMPRWSGYNDSPARIRQLSKLPLLQLQAEIRASFPERLGT